VFIEGLKRSDIVRDALRKIWLRRDIAHYLSIFLSLSPFLSFFLSMTWRKLWRHCCSRALVLAHAMRFVCRVIFSSAATRLALMSSFCYQFITKAVQGLDKVGRNNQIVLEMLLVYPTVSVLRLSICCLQKRRDKCDLWQ